VKYSCNDPRSILTRVFIADPSLKITWRDRCANGVQHPFPNTAEACWKAALPPLSKYCSKECGVEAMERKIMPYVRSKAGLSQSSNDLDEAPIPRTPAVKQEMSRLWKGVKEAKRRDAVVVQTAPGPPDTSKPPIISVPQEFNRLTEAYNSLNEELSVLTQDIQIRNRELGFILARGRLAKLAVQWSERGENINRCCYDSRLLIEGAEWEEWVEGVGKSVLEGGIDMGPINPQQARPTGYAGTPDGLKQEESDAGVNATPVDEEELEMEAADSPWCDGRRKCERHSGWQKLCMAEFELNKGTKVSVHSSY
jgi:COMPASS component SPP1